MVPAGNMSRMKQELPLGMRVGARGGELGGRVEPRVNRMVATNASSSNHGVNDGPLWKFTKGAALVFDNIAHGRLISHGKRQPGDAGYEPMTRFMNVVNNVNEQDNINDHQVIVASAANSISERALMELA